MSGPTASRTAAAGARPDETRGGARAASLFAFDDAACEALAARHGTPLFAYDARTVTAQDAALRAALPSRAAIAYAMKANPHPELLRFLAARGAGIDCASGGELRAGAAALRAVGRDPAGTPEAPGLLYAGPGKRDEELALAVQLGARVQAEGWEDLARLDALGAARVGARAAPIAVNLRVHPAAEIAESRAIIGGGGPSAFGVDEEQLPELLTRARTLRHVAIEGLHVFAASNERDAARLAKTHAMVFALARRLRDAHGLDIRQIDLGGGLGVPYAEGETPLDLAAVGRALGALLDEHLWFEGLPILEPGRFLAASCGVYLARVVRLKPSRGVRFAILQGGIHHLLRPALIGEPFPVRCVTSRSAERVPTTLAGPLCTSLDRLGTHALPVDLAPGDLLAFGMTGAYGATESMPRFLSHPVPPEIWVEG